MAESPFVTAFENVLNRRQQQQQFAQDLALRKQQESSLEAYRQAETQRQQAQLMQGLLGLQAQGLIRPGEQTAGATPALPGAGPVPSLPAQPGGQVTLPGAMNIPGAGSFAPVPIEEQQRRELQARLAAIRELGPAQREQKVADITALAGPEANAAAQKVTAVGNAQLPLDIAKLKAEAAAGQEIEKKKLLSWADMAYPNDPAAAQQLMQSHAVKNVFGIQSPQDLLMGKMVPIFQMFADHVNAGGDKASAMKSLAGIADTMRMARSAMDPMFDANYQHIKAQTNLEGAEAGASAFRTAQSKSEDHGFEAASNVTRQIYQENPNISPEQFEREFEKRMPSGLDARASYAYTQEGRQRAQSMRSAAAAEQTGKSEFEKKTGIKLGQGGGKPGGAMPAPPPTAKPQASPIQPAPVVQEPIQTPRSQGASNDYLNGITYEDAIKQMRDSTGLGFFIDPRVAARLAAGPAPKPVVPEDNRPDWTRYIIRK